VRRDLFLLNNEGSKVVDCTFSAPYENDSMNNVLVTLINVNMLIK
jgi:hypothetical protein